MAALATFLPCYVFTILPAPYFKKHGKRPAIVAFVDGVTAAALGAIETIEQEGLVARAQVIGEVVGARFADWRERFAFIGDVRGVGAMRAIEIVGDRRSLEPDKARTERVVDLAARRGLLMVTAGLYGNVIPDP